MNAGYAFVVADILHVGILRYLEISKSLCDFLIVGVLTDEAAASYKRKPVIPFDERVDMIRALRCVDMAVRQNSRDPADTIKELVENGWDINFLTHGDDWPEIPGSDYMKSIGGRVIRTPYYQVQSTTKIIETIIDRGVGK